MLSAIEVHYPVSAFAWERVQELHNRTEPGYNRTYESIRRKFQTKKKQKNAGWHMGYFAPPDRVAHRSPKII
jgi:hypothetical protein